MKWIGNINVISNVIVNIKALIGMCAFSTSRSACAPVFKISISKSQNLASGKLEKQLTFITKEVCDLPTNSAK